MSIQTRWRRRAIRAATAGALMWALWSRRAPDHALAQLPTPPADAEAADAARGSLPKAAQARLPNLQPRTDGFLGGSDERLLDLLTQGRLAKVKKGSGGRSLGFKLYFESGEKGYFKPAQSFSGAIWFAEVAAYHLDRMLGMKRVPPVISHRMRWEQLQEAAGNDRRRSELEIGEDGTIVGALVYWLPQALSPASTPPGWENWIRVEPLSRYAVTPYQRPAAYTKALARRKQVLLDNSKPRLYYDEPPPAPEGELAAALSDMLVLDFLTINIDRWGGNNANVLAYGDERPRLIFLDNGAGFSLGPDRRGLMDDRLAPQQRFRRATVDALRALRIPELEQRLAREAVTPVLSEALLRGLEVRRDALLSHVDALIKTHGADAVLAWP